MRASSGTAADGGSPPPSVVPRRLRARDFAVPLAATAVMAAILLWMGRVPVCTCGTVRLWHGSIQSSETSQHLLDPYTFTHIVHGFLFYFAAWLVGRVLGRQPAPGFALGAAALAEGLWEIVENAPFAIERFRKGTINLHYYGDSVLNSTGDMLAMVVGFWIASRLPAWTVAVAAVTTEVVLAVLVRDNLVLQFLMFVHPIEAVKAWQMG